MKALKILGVFLLIIVIVGVILAVIAPSKLSVSRSVVIDRSANIVFTEVNDLSKWGAWSPWEKKDSTIVNTFSENPVGVGAVMSWTSENSGSGSQEITESRASEHIKTMLKMDDWESVSYSEWSFEESGDSTEVTWLFDGEEIGFPMNIMNLFIKGMLEEQYELGLSGLKEVVEAKPRIVIKNITAEVFASELSQTQHIITMIDTTTPDGIAKVYENAYLMIGAFMAEHGLEKEAAPVGIYHSYSDSLVILEAGIPVAKAVEVPDGMNMLEIPPTRVASATHVGSWETIGETHEAIDQWIEENGAEMNGYPWHVYFNTLEEAGDPSRLYTQVHYPIK